MWALLSVLFLTSFSHPALAGGGSKKSKTPEPRCLPENRQTYFAPEENTKTSSHLLPTVQALDLSEYFAARISMIQQAKKRLELAYYIFWDRDYQSKRIWAELMKRALEGLPVRVLLDGIGPDPSGNLSSEMTAMILASGVQLGVYHPKKRIFSIRYRMHDKLMVADEVAILGTGNLWSSHFNGGIQNEDVLVRGPVVDDVANHFACIWESGHVSRLKVEKSESLLKRTLEFIQTFGSRVNAEQIDLSDALKHPVLPVQSMRYVHDAPQKDPDSGSFHELKALIESTKESVTIVTPYPMFPDALKSVIRNLGRRLTLITTDPITLLKEFPSLYSAYRSQFSFFESAGIRVLEHRGAFQHRKLVVVDQQKLYIGASNMDILAARYNTENGIIIEDFINTERDTYMQYLQTLLQGIEQESFVAVENGKRTYDPPPCEEGWPLCSLAWVFYPGLSEGDGDLK